MWIILFTVVVIAMTLLVMYKKEKNVLRRMMARGRCGLPGMPNVKFNVPPDPWGDGCEDDDGKKKEKDPFDSQLITLAKIIVEKRKQITDSKGRVNKAENALQNLHITSISLRRKYQDIMDNLREELESAELECQDLNKYIGKANTLKEKFFSTTDDDDECGSKALPAPPKKVSEEQWESLPLCSSSPEKKTKYTCHPPVQKPKNLKSPTTCKCPSRSANPLSTCRPPPPTCCPKKPEPDQGCCSSPNVNSSSVNKYQSDPSMGTCCKPPPTSSCCSPPPTNNCCSPPPTSSCSSPPPTSSCSSPPPTSSCCSPPQPSSNTNSLPCPPPLPSLLPKLSPECSKMLNLPSDSTNCGNSNSCCGTENSSPPPQQTVDQCDPCSRPKPQSCSSCPPSPPPPECKCCKCPEPSPPPCPSPQFVRRPPFSSFLQERMPSQPIQRRSFKQTVVTEECIEGDEDEATSWLEPNTIVTEVTTSSVTFPPNCCVSAYEEFLNAALNSKPKKEVKLPVIIDECDPCAVVPREISPWEDIENVTHTCGTQTKEDEQEVRYGRGGRKRKS